MVGGRIENHETVREGLVREVLEESGLSVIPGEVLGVFDGFPVIRGIKSHVVRAYFLCEAINDQVSLSKDHDKHIWINPKDKEGLDLMDDIKEMLDMAAAKFGTMQLQ
jgi:8-oxo-dGTP pyrophosphatase MutT (NUDIX family)